MMGVGERSRRAVLAAVGLARAHGISVGEPVVLADQLSVMVHLHPAPVVARIATCMPRLRSPIEDWLRLELDVTTFLTANGAPVVAPSQELPPGPHSAGGFAISFWQYLEPDPDRTPTTEDCAAMLADLHPVLANYPGELPLVCANDIPRAIELLGSGRDFLSPEEVDLLRTSAARLTPLPPGRPLHGDPHRGNLMATRDGLIWIDFEDVCRGPIEWDLAAMMDADVLTTHQADSELLAHCTQLRTLQIALAMVTFYDDFGHRDSWDARLRSLLRTLGSSSLRRAAG